MSRSLDLPATEGVDALAHELAKLQDNGKRRIAFLGSRHVPVVDIHLIELIARSLAEEGHNILTSGSQGVNAAVIRAVLDINPSLLTVLGDPLSQLIHRAEELEVPILKVELDTLSSVEIIEQAFGHVRIHESIKASYAIQLVQEHVNLKRILEKIDFPCNFSDKC